MTDTPETDAENKRITESWSHNAGDYCKMLEFARKLERERDEAVRSCHIWQKGHSDIVAERDRLLEALEMLMSQAPNNDCERDGYDCWECGIMQQKRLLLSRKNQND